MVDDLPLKTRSDAEILTAMMIEKKGLKKAIAALDEANKAMEAHQSASPGKAADESTAAQD